MLRTRVAVGAYGMETPLGRYYVMAKFRPTAPILGAFGFETSAYSKLSEWPGGGIVGIHGTNTPSLLGQAVSHGCIRVANEAILRLRDLVPVGHADQDHGVAVQRGSTALTTVGPPGALSISSRPPSSRSRSRIPTTPIPLCPSSSRWTAHRSKPWPSSLTSMQTPSSSSHSATATAEAPLCWRMLLSASCSTRSSAIRCEAVSVSNEPSRSSEVESAGAPAQRRQLPLDRLRERQLQERARLERVREVAQVLVQLRQLRLEVGEAADDRVAMLASDQRDDLLAQQPDVLGEGVDLLQRAVVQVESEPDEQPLVRLGEPGLAGSPPRTSRSCAHRRRLGRLDGQRRHAARAIGVPRRLRPARDAELAVDVAEVELHRLLADPELAADLAVREPARDRVEDGRLALAQHGRAGRLRSVSGSVSAPDRERRARERRAQHRRPGRPARPS